MIRFGPFSLPIKLVALAVAVVIVVPIVALVYWFVFGYVTVISPVEGAYVYMEKSPLPEPLPHTYKLRPQRATLYIEATGYLTASSRVNVWPFMRRTVRVSLERDYSMETDHYRIFYNYERAAYVIVPKIPFSARVSPADQLATYWSEYESYGKEALAALRKAGAEPKQLPIEWWARDWWPAGKSIPIE